MAKDNQGGVPIIIFIPFLLCLVAIVYLLNLRRQSIQQQAAGEDFNGYNAIQDLAHHEQQEAFLDEFPAEDDQDQEDDDEDNNAGEGSSTAVRVKKVGKKRGEKLRRKEQMRQYREYMDQQRELRRQQEQLVEQEFQRKKMENEINRADELEKRRKEKEKRMKQEEKEEQKKQKLKEKEIKMRQARFNKYSGKLKKMIKENKVNQIKETAQQIGLSKQETTEILNQLCKEDTEFELSLWSGNRDTFLFITKQDYDQFNQDLKLHGKMSIHLASL